MPVLFKDVSKIKDEDVSRECKGIKKGKVLVAQSCPSLCYPMNYSPAGSAVLGILQARILTG